MNYRKGTYGGILCRFSVKVQKRNFPAGFQYRSLPTGVACNRFGFERHYRRRNPPKRKIMSDLEQGLAAYLGGYLRGQPANLTMIRHYPSWAGMAQRELDRRAPQLLTSLPDEELRAIASGQINLPQLAGEVYARIHPQGAVKTGQVGMTVPEVLRTPSLAMAAAQSTSGQADQDYQDNNAARAPAPGR
jgi:hypothetical protein